MNDIINQILQSFLEKLKNDSMYKNLDLDNLTYEDLNKFSNLVGDYVRKAVKETIHEDMFTDKKMPIELADAINESILKRNHQYLSDLCVKAQENLNDKYKLNLKPQTVDYNSDDVHGLSKYINEADTYSQREASYLQKLNLYHQKVVDDHVKENAKFLADSGGKPFILRKGHWGMCKWCAALTGEYEYSSNMDTTVFKRHENCGCTVSYVPYKGAKKMQDVWSKKWKDRGTITRRIETIKSRVMTPKDVENKTNSTNENLNRLKNEDKPLHSVEIRNATNITKEFIKEAKPGIGSISNAEYVIVNGVRYETNDENRIEHKNNETAVAEWFVENFGGKLEYLPRVEEKDGVKSADYRINGINWDLKEITGTSRHTFYHALEKKKGQSENFIFDITKSEITKENIIKGLNEVYLSEKTEFVDKLLIKKDLTLLIVTKRKK